MGETLVTVTVGGATERCESIDRWLNRTPQVAAISAIRIEWRSDNASVESVMQVAATHADAKAD